MGKMASVDGVASGLGGERRRMGRLSTSPGFGEGTTPRLESGYVSVEAGVASTATPRHTEVHAGLGADVHAHLAQLVCVLEVAASLQLMGLPH